MQLPSRKITYIILVSLLTITIAFFLDSKFNQGTIVGNILLRGGKSPDRVKIIKVGKATQKITDDLLSAYLEAKQSGRKINPDELVKKILKDGAPARELQFYKSADLVIDEKTDKTAFKAYGNAMGKAFYANSKGQLPDINKIFNEAVTTENKELLKKLSPAESAYRKMSEEMLLIKVPASIVQNHIKLMNSLKLIADNLLILQTFFDDPVQGIYAYNYLKTDYANIADALVENVKIVSRSNAVFTKTEPGYMYVLLKI